MAQSFLAYVSNKLREVAGLVTSTGASDAGKIPALDSTGRLDVSLMPVGIAPDVKVANASEALSAGDYVNVYDVSGTTTVRKASAADDTKPAVGYVLDNVTISTNATVYFDGTNTALTGLTAGVRYYLSASTPGAVVAQSSAPAANGNILQYLGTAISTTEINTEIGEPVTRVT